MTSGTLNVTADTPILAVEHLLTNILVGHKPHNAKNGSFMLGYSVEADVIQTLILNAIREIGDLASEHSAGVIGCEVSGLQQTDEGHRLWGIVECVPSLGDVRQATRVDDVVLERVGPMTWHLTARLITKETT